MPTKDVIPAKDLLVDLAIRYGFQVLGALAILAVGALAARWVGTLVERRLRWMEPPMRMLAVRTVRIVVMLFAVVLAVDKFGFQIAPLVAGIGVAGLGIGIALQGVLSNVIAGLTIIFTKPYRVGEYIELVGAHGDVVAIELFSTTLLHPDRSRVIIPNRKIVGEILHNFGTMRQLRLSVLVPHAADIGEVLDLARAVLAAEPGVLADPPAVIGISQVSEAGLRLSVQPWVRATDVVPAEAGIYRALVERLRARGVHVPASRHDVRILDGSAVAARAATGA